MKFPNWFLALVLMGGCSTQEPPSTPAAAASLPAPSVASTSPSGSAPASVAQTTPAVSKSSAAAAPLTDENGLEKGDMAIDFTGEVVYGGSGKLSLSTFVGSNPTQAKDGAIVAFGASWCGRCRESLPTLKTLQAENKGLQIIYVGTDKDEAGWQQEIAAFKEKALNFPLVRVSDPDGLMQAYFGNERNIPRFYLVDWGGTMVLKDTGFTEKKMGKLLPKQVAYLMKLSANRGS